MVKWGKLVGSGTDKVFYENDQTVTQSYTISAGKNAMVAKSIAIASGETVTVPSGSRTNYRINIGVIS